MRSPLSDVKRFFATLRMTWDRTFLGVILRERSDRRIPEILHFVQNDIKRAFLRVILREARLWRDDRRIPEILHFVQNDIKRAFLRVILRERSDRRISSFSKGIAAKVEGK